MIPSLLPQGTGPAVPVLSPAAAADESAAFEAVIVEACEPFDGGARAGGLPAEPATDDIPVAADAGAPQAIVVWTFPSEPHCGLSAEPSAGESAPATNAGVPPAPAAEASSVGRSSTEEAGASARADAAQPQMNGPAASLLDDGTHSRVGFARRATEAGRLEEGVDDGGARGLITGRGQRQATDADASEPPARMHAAMSPAGSDGSIDRSALARPQLHGMAESARTLAEGGLGAPPHARVRANGHGTSSADTAPPAAGAVAGSVAAAGLARQMFFDAGLAADLPHSIEASTAVATMPVTDDSGAGGESGSRPEDGAHRTEPTAAAVRPGPAPAGALSHASAVLRPPAALPPGLTVAQEATHAHAPENLTRLVQALRVQTRNGVQEATVRLRPEHLGEVTIAVRVDGRAVSAIVHAESADVREWLQMQEGALRGGLTEHGLHLERLHVQRDGRHEREAQAPPQERGRAPRPRRDAGDEPRFEIIV